jgi:cell division protein FtsW
MGLGVVLSFAASPAVAERIGLDTFYFAKRQMLFMIPALGAMLAVSFLGHRQVRRLAVIMLALSLLAMVAVLFVGFSAKGAARWLSIGGLSIQPSEFLKPGFVVICAWLLSEHIRKPDIPGNLLAMGLLAVVIALLVAQPDMGQTILILGTWGVMFFLAGMSWFWIVALGGAAAAGGVLAYLTIDHFAGRINRFMTGEGDHFQVNMGRDALINGGWFGVGPGEGIDKKMIPDSHADFVFAVAGEEYGLVMCMVIAAIFAFVVLRGLNVALKEHDNFTRFSVAGLVTIFGFQSVINMGVNLQLLPAKGMTLPFISYGGSSLIAMAISMGMVLALSRRRPETLRKNRGRIAFNEALVPAE